MSFEATPSAKPDAVNVPVATDLVMNEFNADYYAIRTYARHLTAEEKAQNHFADLCGYHGIDNVDVFFALSFGSKDDLYETFNDVLAQDTTKAELEDR